MATWTIAILTLFLTVGPAASQEPVADSSSTTDVATTAMIEDRLSPKREAVETALADRDAVQKFDWLRRKRNELQTLRPRQTAALSEVDDKIASLDLELNQVRAELENIPFEISRVEYRDQLAARIEALKEELDQPSYSEDFDYKDITQQLSDAEDEITYYDPTTTVEDFKGRETTLKEQMKQVQARMTALQQRKSQLTNVIDDTSVYLDQLEDEMGLLLMPETAQNRFKLNMTLAFSGLVLIVIMGFFVLSWKDEMVRRAVFSSQSGIQFLTLFSLVIAIILFGILGILEGKELAALLGGLSGYILGRVTNTEARAAEAPRPPVAAAAEEGTAARPQEGERQGAAAAG